MAEHHLCLCFVSPLHNWGVHCHSSCHFHVFANAYKWSCFLHVGLSGFLCVTLKLIYYKRLPVPMCFHYTLNFAFVSSTVSLKCISSPPSLSLLPAKWIYSDRQLDKHTIVVRAFNTVQPHKTWCMSPLMAVLFV